MAMPDFELEVDSESLLGDAHDAELYARNTGRVKQAKRQKYTWIVGSIAALILIIVFLRYLLASRHKHPPVLQDPLVAHLQPEFFHDYGSERVQIKYGPLTVPGSGVNNGMKDFMSEDVKLPCHGCLITWMQAGLEFTDGSYADAQTGMWLHHTVLSSSGKQAVKSCRPSHEQFFASGNERTIVDLTLNGTEKSGYWVGESDKASMMTELMNELEQSQAAILTITFEYIPYMPSDFTSVTSIWLDVGGCKGSEVPVPDKSTSFELSMPSWTSPISGRILSILSHLHDGGVHLDVIKNDLTVCWSAATYGNVPEHAHHMPGMDMSHISSMPICYDIGRIQAGDDWDLKAWYDLSAHQPMLDGNGDPEDVMGIAILYLIED